MSAEPTQLFYRRSIGAEPQCSRCVHYVRLHGRRGCFCIDPPIDDGVGKRWLAYAYGDNPEIRGVRCLCALTPDDFEGRRKPQDAKRSTLA